MNDIERAINKLLNNIDLSRAIEKGSLVIENQAKINCPVDKGNLRQSITHQVDKNVGVVGTNVSYAPYVEFGTGLFAEQGNGRQTPWSYQTADGQWHTTLGQKPQPFLRPAYNEKKKEVIDTVVADIREQIKDACNKQ